MEEQHNPGNLNFEKKTPKTYQPGTVDLSWMYFISAQTNLHYNDYMLIMVSLFDYQDNVTDLFCSILSLFCAFSSDVRIYSRFIPISKHLLSRQCLQNRLFVRSILHCWSYRHLKWSCTDNTQAFTLVALSSTVWVKKIPPEVFWHFSQTVGNF